MIQTVPTPLCNFLISIVALGAQEEALELLLSILIILINPLLKPSLYFSACSNKHPASYCSVLPYTSLIPAPYPLYIPTAPGCFWYFWFSFTGWFPVVRMTPSACGWVHRLRLLGPFNFVCLATSVPKKLQLMKTHLIIVLPYQKG